MWTRNSARRFPPAYRLPPPTAPIITDRFRRVSGSTATRSARTTPGRTESFWPHAGSTVRLGHRRSRRGATRETARPVGSSPRAIRRDGRRATSTTASAGSRRSPRRRRRSGRRSSATRGRMPRRRTAVPPPRSARSRRPIPLRRPGSTSTTTVWGERSARRGSFRPLRSPSGSRSSTRRATPTSPPSGLRTRPPKR